MDELWERRGRLHMAQWFMDRLTEFVRQNPHILAETPDAFRLYLSQMMTDAVEEAHGTRPVEPVQIGA